MKTKWTVLSCKVKVQFPITSFQGEGQSSITK